MPADLLFEIGTEEIPAAFLTRALDHLRGAVTSALAEARLEVAGVGVVGTPRRLAFIASGVGDRQADLSERMVGPPARVAFDADGNPTKAAVGFAKRNGVALDALERSEVDGKKGEYVVCTRNEPGKPAAEVIPGLLESLIGSMPWPKSMRWGGGETPFVRPVHWIVAVLGDAVVPVEFAGIASGNQTRGHRFLAPEPIDVTATTYASALRRAFVIVDPAGRRDMIAAELTRIETEVGAKVRPDAELLDEVAMLVEYPVAVCGEFDAAYLEVPAEVIVLAMRSHQRYFAIEDASGGLLNKFVTIANTVTKDVDVVRRGNQRVLAARLADAQFFFREDQKKSAADRVASLDDVMFTKKLGSIGAKVRRIRSNAAHIAGAVGADTKAVDRAAELCKSDLVTNMVYEFPELQGVMGMHYARLAGEPDAVSTAISEHYLPRGSGDTLPTTDAGAVVGIADRIDTLVGCFAAGLAPTGSADPYGLRRAALAILTVLIDRGWSMTLDALIDRAAESLDGTVEVTAERKAEVAAFFRVRLRGLLVDGNELPADCVEAALTAGYVDVPDARSRAAAVATLRERPDFEPLAVAFKRVANILKGETIAEEPDPDAFVEDEERALWDGFGEIRNRAEERLGAGDYQGSLQVLAELKAPVDRFFDKVLVIHEDDRIRQNRLALLGRINATFTKIADFRQLSV